MISPRTAKMLGRRERENGECEQKQSSVASSKKQKHRESVQLPKSLFEELKVLGVDVKSDEAGLYVFSVKLGDDGWKRYYECVEQLSDDVDPAVSAIFAPPAAIQGTALLYPATQILPILIEANSIISHYAALRRNDFAGVNAPAIPGPIAGFLGIPPTLVHHAAISLTMIHRAIQHPPASYPALNSLGAGSYICTLSVVWSNAATFIELFKP
jgi:hypothetical protein